MDKKLYTVVMILIDTKTGKEKNRRTGSFYGLKLANLLFSLAFRILCAYNTLGETRYPKGTPVAQLWSKLFKLLEG